MSIHTKSLFTCLAASLFGLAGTQAISSCGSSTKPEELCDNCVSIAGHCVFACYGGPAGDVYRGSVCVPCNSVDTEVQYECNLQHTPNTNAVENIACDGTGYSETGTSPKCTNWNPSAEISLIGKNHYEISSTFVDYILEDPNRLEACDPGRVAYDPSEDVYHVTNAISGSFLYELGFRDDDVILQANGVSLLTLEDAATAFGTLYIGDSETQYTFEVDRDDSIIEIRVDIE